MTIPRPTIVIFDMDGTSVRHINPVFLHILEWMDDHAFKIRKLVSRLDPRKDKPVNWAELEPRKTPKLLVHRAIHKARRKPVEQIVEPCPGIYYVLELLKRHNIPMALASNGLGAGYGHDILQKFDLEQYFRVAIFREDIKKSKPNPEPILLTLRRMEISLTADDVIWYIGDRHKDVLACVNAAEHLPCPIVPIAYGFNAAVAIIEKNIGPDHIIMSYFDIYAKLDKLLSSAVTPAPSSVTPASSSVTPAQAGVRQTTESGSAHTPTAGPSSSERSTGS